MMLMIIFMLTFLFVSLDGLDIILGIKWVETLGPILWDLAPPMSSCYKGDLSHSKGDKLLFGYQVQLLQGTQDLATS